MIADPERWCQHDYHNGKRNCAIGAFRKVAPNEYDLWDEAEGILDACAPIPVPGGVAAAVWVNDNSDHATVLKMFDRAIVLAEETA